MYYHEFLLYAYIGHAPLREQTNAAIFTAYRCASSRGIPFNNDMIKAAEKHPLLQRYRQLLLSE